MPQSPPIAPSPPSAGTRDHTYDVVVIGAGVAGLAFALRLPSDWRVALLTKGVLGESNTRYAQGGLAAAVGHDDDPSLHEAEPLAAGAGLCDPTAVRRLVADAPAAVAWLVGLGARFDTGPDGAPLLGREAAHSRRRVLHAGGDATGAEIERALVDAVGGAPGVAIFEDAFALDLLVVGGRCEGVVAQLGPGGPAVHLRAGVTALAAGGAGQLSVTTTNPLGATADGLAMALRAGVAVADLEFAQFHPTVLALPGGSPFLVSEAVRGEGAHLRGGDGRRFMLGLHPLAELAPRDVVARGIQRQMAVDEADHVFLDLRHLDAAAMRARFPTITRELSERGLDLAFDPLPVAPAAHYFMGGVVSGSAGETNLPGLLALGVAACTGVHGANRLASNSLLEGLVSGLVSAERLGWEGKEGRGTTDGTDGASSAPLGTARPGGGGSIPAPATLRARLQCAMSRHVAVVRDAAGLAAAAREIRAIGDQLARPAVADGVGDRRADAVALDGSVAGDPLRSAWELRNTVDAAGAVAVAAARREESRGAHFRRDFPETDSTLAERHLIRTAEGWRYGALATALRAETTSPWAGRGSPAGSMAVNPRPSTT